VNEAVDAKYGGGKKLHLGKIIKANDDGTYDIEYVDGDKEQSVGLVMIVGCFRGDSSDDNTSEFLDLSALLMTSVPLQINTLAASLFSLNLRRNDLTSLPDALFELTSLTSLDIADNHLFVLPAAIGRLKRLKKLALGRNRLERLPVQLVALKQLKDLGIELNPLLEPPKAICSEGLDAIISFMKDALSTGTVLNNRVKVIVVGDGEAGKTSLLKSLKAGKAFLQRVGELELALLLCEHTYWQ
jgi:hypothetical protein